MSEKLPADPTSRIAGHDEWCHKVNNPDENCNCGAEPTSREPSKESLERARVWLSHRFDYELEKEFSVDVRKLAFAFDAVAKEARAAALADSEKRAAQVVGPDGSGNATGANVPAGVGAASQQRVSAEMPKRAVRDFDGRNIVLEPAQPAAAPADPNQTHLGEPRSVYVECDDAKCGCHNFITQQRAIASKLERGQ